MKGLLPILLLLCTSTPLDAQHLGSDISWDATSLMVNGQRVIPAMGEMHYTRVPAAEWRAEVRKMKAGGINLLSTYVFWNHHEEDEDVFTWQNERDLRTFLYVCQEEDMPVVLRIGPFCHGEARSGGIPDWLFAKNVKLRSEDADFLAEVRKWYTAIFQQVDGLQWKDGGPVIACQFDNEFHGKGSYLMALKQMALEIGFDLPFYTRTGWPALTSPVPYGEMVPLFGDYADGFWDRSTEERVGGYWKAFHFCPPQLPTAIATEQLGEQAADTADAGYPYFTCELGGGMATSYHRRPYLYAEDAYAMAVVKLGSGSNLLGYYMYHGGSNPKSLSTVAEPSAGNQQVYLNENQRTQGTNYNDLPILDYDFQAPIGACGQLNPHYYSLRRLHLFMQDFGDILAPMHALFPDTLPIGKDDERLRFALRTDGQGTFLFINNYDRLHPLPDQHIDMPGQAEPLVIPSGTVCILPENIVVDGLRIDAASAQLLARRNGALYFFAIDGIKPFISINGQRITPPAPLGEHTPVATIDGTAIYLLTANDAGHIFLPHEAEPTLTDVPFSKTADAPCTQRTISTGVHKVAEQPTDSEFLAYAARYEIPVPGRSGLLRINYQGDCARLYVGEQPVADNFYNGRPFDFALWRLPDEVDTVRLLILPMQADMPVYFPHEANTSPGEQVYAITHIR